MWKFSKDKKTNVLVRDVEINTDKGGRPVKILHVTDIHFNYCTEDDLKNPTLASTWENHKYLKIQRDSNGKYSNVYDRHFSIRHMEGSAEFIKEQAADQLVVTGDIMSYLSEGNLKLAKLYVFDAFDNVLATLGNHEAIQKMQGTVEESLSLEERMSILKDIWCNDISYVSKVLEDKVMLVLMDNSTVGRYGSFTDSQVENLKKDLTLARANGYSVLLFYHIPLATENSADRQKCAEPYVEGDANTKVWDFETRGINSSAEDKASRDMYQLITQNGDVIKAAFCGHKHNDYTTEIIATDINGQKTVIPQYILIGNTYGGKDIAGNVLRITIN